MGLYRDVRPEHRFGILGARSAVGRAQTAAIFGLFLHILIVIFGFAIAAVIGAWL